LNKLIIISFSLIKGGSGIAASKFKNLLQFNSISLELVSISQDSANIFHFFKRLFSYAIVYLQFDGNPIKHSLNLFSYKPVLNAFRFQYKSIFHFHWLNNDTLSVFDFNKIPTYSIITLHDEWFYCGAEHYYKTSDESNDFINGYKLFKKGVFGIHWNYIIWKIKFSKLAHRNDLIFTVPSNWMLERAKSSALLNKFDIRLLPNPIDTSSFIPMKQNEIELFRDKINISKDNFIFLFGAVAGKSNKIKGMEYVYHAFKLLRLRINPTLLNKVILIDFGGKKSEGIIHGFRNISLGRISDTSFLSKLYSCSDCTIVPSKVESFGQVAAESLSCETPVICFRTSGLTDIVIDNKSGFYCEPYLVNSLADCLFNMLTISKSERENMGKFGREYVIKNFSNDIILEKYLKIINDVFQLKKNTE
jgi:glycosyltransferase involved in cell wall biosynthesis